MKPEPLTTALFMRHQAAGANMGDFGGYRMPLWYPAGMRREHRAVILAAGLFDTSHMAVLTVNGPGARGLLQQTFTKDLDRVSPTNQSLAPGRCVYGAFCDSRGHLIDDTIVYRQGVEDYFVVVNAGMGPIVAAHLLRYADSSEAAVVDMTGKIAKLDLQGPAAAKILGRLLADPQTVFNRLPYFAFKGHFESRHPDADTVRLNDGTSLLLSRTGYTGEFGFEIFMAPEAAVLMWDRLLEAGADFGLLPCGLAARDSLRTGAVLPLSHQDIGDWPFIHHPWSFALPYGPDGRIFTKDFVGASALIQAAGKAAHTLAFVGCDQRKVAAGPQTRVLDAKGRSIGVVLTCATDTAIGWVDAKIMSIASLQRPANFDPKGLSCGFVRVDFPLAPGTQLILDDRRRSIEVLIVKDIRPDRTARMPINRMWG